MDQTPVRRQQYSLEQISFMVQYLLLSGRIGFRAASRVVEATISFFGIQWEVPSPTTARSWLLRIALYQLHSLRTIANDWVWIVDHTVKIGPDRCLVVMGVRASELPPLGVPLRLQDLHLLQLFPVVNSDQHVVEQQLEATIAKTGVPRMILHDYGSDLKAGIQRFCAKHPETQSLYDVAHKGANLLKGRLEKDPQWKLFCTQVGQTKFKTQQTELAFLVPPSQRSKARYMNLGPLLRWARGTLRILKNHPPEVLKFCSVERLEEKLGWLRGFETCLAEWSEYEILLDEAIDEVRCYGYAHDTAYRVALRLMPKVCSVKGRELKDEFVAFVAGESSLLRPDERLPGSSEILESAFGKLKSMEGEHQKCGFTSLLLSLGALVGRIDRDTIQKALIEIPGKRVETWISENLGCTHHSKRQLAYSAQRNKPSVNTKPLQYQL